ncbi:neuroligin-1-like isoform X2 [Pectinophora gossypiella]|uniref:neuroligin-1-like isoform X2 n=1 Tax=Pectinophora gossypiella TaxID=13191 RepID=UPI00214F1378|nr:neuroligin-1-like isoform X2 [Pectinophora gossypiella]
MEWSRRAWCWCAWLALAALAAAGPRYSSRIVHTHAGAIRGVIVEPASRRLEPVEAFLGVPYAGPPARLRAPPSAPTWPGTRLADAFAPVCPQQHPDISNKSAALTRMPLGVYHELVAAAPLLANQSEDCLYLNIYVPGSGARGVEAPYAVVAWLGAAAHEWGSGNALDGAVLAARAHLLVVTINYRLGLLGYLTSGEAGDAASAAGGAALLDVAAALAWLRRNIAAFGGDPRRVTLAGHNAGASLANTLLMQNTAKGLVSRVLLLSGSALSPAALAPDAALAREHAAQALRCHRDTPGEEHWLVACVQSRPLSALRALQAPRARFLAGWAPAPPRPPRADPAPARALHASDAFLDCALAVVLTTTESYHYFSEDDIRHGFEEEHRNRILRTYVRNVYRYHRNEIFAAIRNEYTDWEKPIQHPINIRDATLEALSDAAGAAPALRVAQIHARRGASTYVAHFAHQTRDADYPQRLGSVTGESLPYFLGLPLVGGGAAGARNYSRADAAVADAAVGLLAALAKTGDPARPEPGRHDSWPRYDLNTQQYLSIGTKLRVKSHYRGHKLALWLHLVPQLHRPGAAPRHHQFRQLNPDMFAGEVFPELYTTAAVLGEPDADAEEEAEAEADAGAEEDECSPSPHPAPAAPAPVTPTPSDEELASLDSHYYSYTVALGVTVGAGCFLLALNVLVFAGIYLQRARTRRRPRRHGSTASRAATPAECGAASPRKSTLKRSSESELKERPGNVAPPKKRVQIQEISV